MNISQLGEAINKYFSTSNTTIIMKILKALGDDVFLVETFSGSMKVKITGEINIGDVIRAKLLAKTPLPIFEKVSSETLNMKSSNSILKILDSFNANNFEAYFLNSLESESIRNMVNLEKLKLLNILEKQLDSGDKIDLNNLNKLDFLKINSKELYQLIFNRILLIYFRAPEYDIKDGFLYIKKSKNRGIKCKLFLYFSNIGRVFIIISGLNEQYNVMIKSDTDLTSLLKNIAIEHVSIGYKKINMKKYDKDDFSHSNYFTIKV